jgi:glutamate-1-semialdehyde 2,1-aminomutase
LTPILDRTRLSDLHARERRSFLAAHPRSHALAAAAETHLLAGVPMAWMRRWPGDFPLFVADAVQGHFRDVDGIEYLDLCLGDTGAMGGHAIPSVTATVADRANRGATTMLPTEDAAWVAGELARRFGLPSWQFALSATDANRFALRIARAATGRRKILVFDWCYHGTVDETLVVLGADGRVVPREGSLGVPVDPASTTAVVPFNDIDALAAALAPGDIACVLAEPAMTNIGIVLPAPGFHDALRRLTRDTGTLLAIDETHTICAGPGGYTAAHSLDPDLLVIGKPIGGGVPAAAYGLSAAVAAAVRERFEDPSIDVSGIGGTLAGNALSVAAMRAALAGTLREEDFALAIPLAERFTEGAARVIEAHGLPWHVQRLGCRAEYRFGPPPRDGAAAALAGDAELDAFLHLHALNRGVLLTPFHNMALFTPHHSPADADRHTEVFDAALAELFGSAPTMPA